MTPEELTDTLVPILMQISGYREFFTGGNTAGKEGDTLEQHLIRFEEYRQHISPLTSYERMLLQIVREKIAAYTREQVPPILYVNPMQKEDESIVTAFDEDFNNNKTGNFTSMPAEKQHYRSWTEHYLYYEIKDNGLIDKYENACYPLVYIMLSRMTGAAGATEHWFKYLNKALRYAQYYPNRYWHSFYGMYGCTTAIWELYYYLDKWTEIFKRDKQFEIRLFKLLYLYITRTIVLGVTDKMPQVLDLYANRANLCYDKPDLVQCVFLDAGEVVIPDIQYISDSYLAYETAARHSMGPIALQYLHNSKKMYEYGSLSNVGCEDGGYKIIEDATWLELVNRGKKRNLTIGNLLYDQYRQGNLDLNLSDIGEEMSHLFIKHGEQDTPHYNWHPLKE